ncbi:hypothetical protein D3C80_1269790 [compost metagenome]
MLHCVAFGSGVVVEDGAQLIVIVDLDRNGVFLAGGRGADRQLIVVVTHPHDAGVDAGFGIVNRIAHFHQRGLIIAQWDLHFFLRVPCGDGD